MNTLNNINLKATEKFYQEVQANPQVAKKTKRVEGEWRFGEGQPQFQAMLSYQEG